MIQTPAEKLYGANEARCLDGPTQARKDSCDLLAGLALHPQPVQLMTKQLRTRPIPCGAGIGHEDQRRRQARK